MVFQPYKMLELERLSWTHRAQGPVSIPSGEHRYDIAHAHTSQAKAKAKAWGIQLVKIQWFTSQFGQFSTHITKERKACQQCRLPDPCPPHQKRRQQNRRRPTTAEEVVGYSVISRSPFQVSVKRLYRPQVYSAGGGTECSLRHQNLRWWETVSWQPPRRDRGKWQMALKHISRSSCPLLFWEGHRVFCQDSDELRVKPRPARPTWLSAWCPWCHGRAVPLCHQTSQSVENDSSRELLFRCRCQAERSHLLMFHVKCAAHIEVLAKTCSIITIRITTANGLVSWLGVTNVS